MSNADWFGNMPNTASQVAELQTSFIGLGRDKNISYYYDTAMRLEALQDKVKKAEDKFFRELGMSGIEELQGRLDKLNADLGFRSMINLDGTEFDNTVKAAFNKIDPSQEMEFIIQNNHLLQNELATLGTEITVQELITALNKNPNIQVKNMPKIRNYKTDVGKGLGSYFGEIIIVPNSSPLKVKINPKKVDGVFKILDTRWLKRLEEFYDFKLTGLDPFTILKDRVLNMIQNREIKDYVNYEFTVNKDKFDLNSSQASIKGFLGEVHAAAMMDYIFKRKGAVIPTGKLKNYQGQEIPIDMVIKEFGFQVKNYRVVNDTMKSIQRENEAMGAANFITERLRPTASIADIMIDFFGSYQFNQPIEKATENYRQIYTRFSQNEEITKIFNGYLDNILKVSDNFSSNNDLGLFQNQGLFFNTFFIIGEKIIPSSRMLQAIKETLKEYNNKENAISSKYWISTPSGGVTWNKKTPFTGVPAAELANKVKINWIIELKVSEILDKAISKIF